MRCYSGQGVTPRQIKLQVANQSPDVHRHRHQFIFAQFPELLAAFQYRFTQCSVMDGGIGDGV